MKKAVILFFIFIALINFSIAETSYYNSKNIVLDIGINSSAEFKYLKPSGYVDSVSVNMTFFPRQGESQKIVSLKTEPFADAKNGQLQFYWKKPKGKIDFSVDTRVESMQSIKKIKEKIDFPINPERLPSDVLEFTKPSDTIDSGNEKIIKLASEVIEGEDDLYEAVFKIAEWTKNNINYNLSTLTAEVSQKASWVLENRQGVCDELTSLFIAQLRAVGIPAKFTSGIAYTNSDLFPEKWGAHGWAEVYFPGYGWIPFDVTYGQFGWIDPTHIKFKDSFDSDEPSTYYQWSGRNADLLTKKLDIDAQIVENYGIQDDQIILEASSLKNAARFGSYNLIQANIENLNDYYYSVEVYLARPKEVKIMEKDFKSVLLAPKERKTIFWIVQVDDNLDSRFSYTFPFVISTFNNISAKTSFVSNIKEQRVSFEDVESVAYLISNERKKVLQGSTELYCNAQKEEFYVYENVSLGCTVFNSGNTFIENAKLCFQKKCKTLSLGISQSKNLTFEINKSITGNLELPISLTSEALSKSSFAKIRINDIPKVEIADVSFPENAAYKDNFKVEFTISRKSESRPKEVEIKFLENSLSKNWKIDSLSEDRKFVIDFKGNKLRYGNNIFAVEVEYLDDLGKKYYEKKEFSISLSKANLLQRMFLSFSYLSRTSSVAVILILAVSFLFSIPIILWILRKQKE